MALPENGVVVVNQGATVATFGLPCDNDVPQTYVTMQHAPFVRVPVSYQRCQQSNDIMQSKTCLEWRPSLHRQALEEILQT